MAKRRNRKRSGGIAREDYTKGGRVGYALGDTVNESIRTVLDREEIDRQKTQRQRELDNQPDINTGGRPPSNLGRGRDEAGQIPNFPSAPGGTPPFTPAPTPAPTPSPDMVDAKSRAEQLVSGNITGVPTVPDAVQIEAGKAGVARQMETPTELKTVEAVAPTAPDAVIAPSAQQAKAPTPLTAKQVEAEQITEAPEVAVAEGEVRDEALAEAAEVERVAPIEAAKVEIPEGALIEAVVGTVSPEAKAEAAQVAGTTLARVTRAKKQLANAGLSSADIAELGNDPEALEERLMDFSESERGMIAGLPEEALVSNQLDSLLNGIEEGKIPMWASPAVASVEAMLAQRGMSASTVGRDALLNAIIQSAVPLAQANAQAIQQSVGQQKSIEAQAEITNAQFRQQTALDNAGKVFQMDMANLSNEQQVALSNSKFMQSVGLTEANNKQQATIQNAILMSQANLAEADFYQKTQIQNAQSFMQMDLTNLNNQQQANVIKAQQAQQTLLSNQAATNAARQFNASSENQTQQFMAGLAADVDKFNASQNNSMSQFNTQQINARQALQFQVDADFEKANAQMSNQINQFNADREFQVNKFNVANQQAIEQADLAWRRQINLADTAAQNAVNQQNAQNAFNMSSQAQQFLWQELRDQATFDFQGTENEAQRKVSIAIAALGNEGGSYQGKNWSTNLDSALSVLNRFTGTRG